MPPQQPYGPPPQFQLPTQPTAPISGSEMNKHHNSPLLLIGMIVAVVLFLAAAGFGFWAFGERNDFKNNVDKKANVIANEAVKVSNAKKDAELVEKEKNPLKKYQGPPAFGSLDISYPKTWSAYVIQDDKSSVPVDGYLHPDYVPGVLSGTAYALRFRVTSQAYAQELKQFDGKSKSGKVKITAYVPKNVAGVNGSRIEGEINTGQKDYMIMVPLRDKTLKIWTETPSFLNDFDKIILENLKFVP